MRKSAGYLLLLPALGLAACAQSTGPSGFPSYQLAERCAEASGFTARAKQDPAYDTGKVHATPAELAYMNRCVAAAGVVEIKAPPRNAKTTPPEARGTLPFPNGYPMLSGDQALWQTLTAAQQRRAILFLQSGSTIQSSLLGD